MKSTLFAWTLALLCLLGTARAQTPPDPTPNLGLEYLASGNWFPGEVNTMLRQPDGKLLIGGRFDRVYGTTLRSNLLRLNRDGSLDASFAPVFTSGTANYVRSLAYSGGKIYVGGLFEGVNGFTRYSVARLDYDGSTDTSWSSPFSSTSANDIRAIAVTGAGVYLGGDILDANLWGLARLSATTGAFDATWTAPTQYNPTASPIAGNRGTIAAIVVAADGDLIVGGEFGQIAGVTRTGVARLSQSSPPTVRAFDAGITGRAYALVLGGGQLYVGGNFFRTNGIGANYLNRMNAASGALDTGFAPTLNGSVFALDLVGNALYAGGSFQALSNGGARLARLPVTGNGAIDAAWNPSAAGGTVLAIADDCVGQLYVGGDYLTVSSQTWNGLSTFSIPQLECIFTNGFDPL